ncbi:hypothetical protein RHGRI_032082 [Rhododendron griersonianum]|uniref:Glutathione S-transferase n=1 Tax=Rhododendron griersonianum TaxID=479676 RepID=A0AAV6IDJ4_9ERIC|nr:hypothetical protein RHGRI_032082 [Rhododendron griersonianum]
MASSVEQQKKLKLYSYFRSSCSHRVRIALKLKEFTKLNPIGYVPVLVDEDIVVSDSFAILLVSGLGIYPLHLMSVKYIAEKVNSDEQYVWARNHIGKGFEALEKLLHDYAGKYATGDEVYLTPYPLLSRLNEAYNQLPAFVDSAPENQPDTPV